jgi:hypothetical protein
LLTPLPSAESTPFPRSPCPATSFRDVHSYRRRGAPHLTGQAVHFVATEDFARCIDIESQSLRLLPDFKCTKTLHVVSPLLLITDN